LPNHTVEGSEDVLCSPVHCNKNGDIEQCTSHTRNSCDLSNVAGKHLDVSKRSSQMTKSGISCMITKANGSLPCGSCHH